MSETRFSPYQGLVPFDEEDALFFFGRETEREVVIANLLGARLTLLYGVSGVGKSSLLRAGVTHQLKQRATQRPDEPPPWVVVPFSAWSDEPVAALLLRCRQALAAALGVAPDEVEPPAGGLLESLHGWSTRYRTRLLLILDQFEEFFLYHEGQSAPGTFAAELPRVLNDPTLRVHVLLSLREDALSRLDAFKGQVPHLFSNLLRVEHLDEAAAREAIVRPLEQYNWLFADPGEEVGIEPALVEAVLTEVRAGKVALGEGRGTTEAESDERVEAPFLQLVLQRLWSEEQAAGSQELRLATLERLGGAEQIVRTHLDGAMTRLPADEQRTAATIFDRLVTPSGSKIALSVSDLARFAAQREEALLPMLERLARMDARILRPVAPPLDQPDAKRYEIFHDVLAPAILDSSVTAQRNSLPLSGWTTIWAALLFVVH